MLTNVGARWTSGVLEFFDKATGTTIFSIDGPNLLATGGALALSKLTYPVVARTATTDGLTTGTIADAGLLQFVSVTAGGDANSIIVLPTPTPGTIVILHVAATGYELRTSAPGTVGINGGTGTAAESAIGANVTAVLICATATAWKGFQMAAAGTLTLVEVAAP